MSLKNVILSKCVACLIQNFNEKNQMVSHENLLQIHGTESSLFGGRQFARLRVLHDIVTAS